MSETVTQVSDTEQKIVRSRTCGCRDFYIATVENRGGGQSGTPARGRGDRQGDGCSRISHAEILRHRRHRGDRVRKGERR